MVTTGASCLALRCYRQYGSIWFLETTDILLDPRSTRRSGPAAVKTERKAALQRICAGFMIFEASGRFRVERRSLQIYNDLKELIARK